MMRSSGSDGAAATRWSMRLVPCIVFASFVVPSYAFIHRVCVHDLYHTRRKTGLFVAMLVLYVLFIFLTMAAYLRTALAIQRDPGLVPLIHDLDPGGKTQTDRKAARGRDLEANPWVPPDQNPDSPGLEAFYSKDVFVCEADGRPKWCSECRQWKPDRAHHSRELGRCVRKMDHLCPWVGGMVSETSFNFFFQFTLYTVCLCAVGVGASAYCLQQQSSRGPSVDGWVISVVAVTSFYAFFASAMVLTSLRFIFTNITNIDVLKKSQVVYLAVRIPRHSPPSTRFSTIVYPLPRPAPWPTSQRAPAPPTGADLDPASARDQRATRKFAILRADNRENPWDLGFWANWKSVMGNHVVDWLLPLRHSPCCNHESMRSDYELGPLLTKLKRQYDVPDLDGDVGGTVEMHDAIRRTT
ncbi:hypothetical protein CDD83_2635 [Cordyceps sp. RAO-2017]|nr:hypothetical protein CDD83_2635 [Cordyceps sp. RAO-2017]